MLELKERISEGIVEDAKQQAANLLVSVKKEKMLELAVEKVEEAASSSEITWFLEKTMDESQVRQALSIFCFLCSAFFLGLTLVLIYDDITTSATSNTNQHQQPEARRRARRA